MVVVARPARAKRSGISLIGSQNISHAAEIVGVSAATCRLRRQITRAASFSSNVLVTGPSGSGKELVARALHAQSPRAREHFIPVDCASLFGDMMASQLFGHVAGAFTGASYAALGCFRAADQGTIFLDEIGEMELPLQARLLRVIQERVVTPVGSHEGIHVDVRIVAATNRDLAAEVAAGRFREDLFFRLNVVSIRTEPLGARPMDIGPLAEEMLGEMADHGMPRRELTPGALETLERYGWPGNVRQLKNVLEQAVISSDGPLLTRELVAPLLVGPPASPFARADLTEPVGAGRMHSPASDALPGEGPVSDETWPTMADVEREHLVSTLERTYYNQSAAARLLGISRQSLIRKIAKHAIGLPRRPK